MDIMEKIVLNATRRSETGKKTKALRRQGKLPAVMYGHHFEATPITLDLREATRTLSRLTGSSLVTVNLDGTEQITLVQEKQRDVIKGTLLHLDFWAVSMTEKLHTSVDVEIVGVSPAVRNFNGFVTIGTTEIDVECLPADLPEKIVVDISTLDKIGSSIHVRDIKLSEAVTVLSDLDLMVVAITLGESGEGEEGVTTEGEAVAEPEVIEKVRKTEEEE